jgi:DNA-directed RNA polymerase subunit RPC12/RpoP
VVCIKFDFFVLKFLYSVKGLTFMTEHPNHETQIAIEGFEQVDSLVSGVTVYAPKSKPQEGEKSKVYDCPNCGATTAYDVSGGGIACEHCGYISPVKSKTLGKIADEFEFTLETISQAERGWGTRRQGLHCHACGAELSLPQGVISTSCPYCASNQVNLTTSLEEFIQPRFLIPFKITIEQTHQLAKTWLGQGWFHPDELSASSVMRRFSGIYLPFWTFDASVTAHWKAQVGYQKTVRHYDASQKRWETRTKIEWRWENGTVPINIDDHLVTGSSSQHISHKILERIYPYQMKDLTAYHPDYLAGWQAQAYETTLTDAWETGKQAIREAAKEACYQDIPTSHVRNFSMTADFADESWRYILLPVYLAAYKFQDKTYQIMVNGQTGLVAGQKPVAWWKIWLAIAALLLPGLILGLIGLPLLLIGGAGILPIGAGIILFGIGSVLSIMLYNKARQSEAK